MEHNVYRIIFLLIIILIVVDLIFNDHQVLLFLAKKTLDFFDFVAFWR